MDDIQRLYRESPAEVGGDQEDRDTIHCENAECRKPFLVEHVGDATAWRCPACQTAHHNLHLHFVLLGVATAFLVLASFAVLIVFLTLKPPEVSLVPYVIWSAVQISLALYVVLAIFSDSRAYGLAALRVLIPVVAASFGAFITLLGMKLWFWFVFIGGPVFLAGYVYLAWVFLHAFRMADMHRPREAVIRPMYTLISITAHVLVLTAFAVLFIPELRTTPGTSAIEWGTPGGYVPTARELEELEKPEEEVDIEEEEIEPELEEIKTPEKHDIDYQTENEVIFSKVDREDKPRIRPRRHITRNVVYQARYDRQYALEQGGGSDNTELAVMRALYWLRDHQNDDGSWGEDPLKPSMTALALLCFLGHGEDHLSPEFGRTVRLALEWLMGHQDAEGYLAHDFRYAYQHGMATYALAEAYAMTELERIKPVVKKAVEVILHGQTDEGGWYYGYTKGGVTVTEYETGRQYFKGDWPGGDTSVSGWQIQALTAAWYAGIRFPNNALKNSRYKALQDIKSRVNAAEGWSGYQDTSPAMHGDSVSEKKSKAYALTGIATLCLQFLGEAASGAVNSMLATMQRYRFDWDNCQGGWQGAPLYAWYYVTQAKYHAAAPTPKTNREWMRWNAQMTSTLITEQNDDGSWGFPKKSREGTEHVAGTKNKPVYATTLCCLMLEVYYRYLPTYQTR
jgi:hypothetical protein